RAAMQSIETPGSVSGTEAAEHAGAPSPDSDRSRLRDRDEAGQTALGRPRDPSAILVRRRPRAPNSGPTPGSAYRRLRLLDLRSRLRSTGVTAGPLRRRSRMRRRDEHLRADRLLRLLGMRGSRR